MVVKACEDRARLPAGELAENEIQDRCQAAIGARRRDGRTAMRTRKPSMEVVVRARWASCQRSRTSAQFAGGPVTDHPCCIVLIGTLIDTLMTKVAAKRRSAVPANQLRLPR